MLFLHGATSTTPCSCSSGCSSKNPAAAATAVNCSRRRSCSSSLVGCLLGRRKWPVADAAAYAGKPPPLSSSPHPPLSGASPVVNNFKIPSFRSSLTAITLVTATMLLVITATSTKSSSNAIEMVVNSSFQQQSSMEETLSDIPQTLSSPENCVNSPFPSSSSSSSSSSSKDNKACKKARIQRPKSRKAESCTGKCVATCIRGGGGSPGEGPLNIRRPLVVFKDGFRSRQYCLIECSDICNLIDDGDSKP